MVSGRQIDDTYVVSYIKILINRHKHLLLQVGSATTQ